MIKTLNGGKFIMVSCLMKRTRGQHLAMEFQTKVINRKEVEAALKGMKRGKAMGPDGIPV